MNNIIYTIAIFLIGFIIGALVFIELRESEIRASEKLEVLEKNHEVVWSKWNKCLKERAKEETYIICDDPKCLKYR